MSLHDYITERKLAQNEGVTFRDVSADSTREAEDGSVLNLDRMRRRSLGLHAVKMVGNLGTESDMHEYVRRHIGFYCWQSGIGKVARELLTSTTITECKKLVATWGFEAGRQWCLQLHEKLLAERKVSVNNGGVDVDTGEIDNAEIGPVRLRGKREACKLRRGLSRRKYRQLYGNIPPDPRVLREDWPYGPNHPDRTCTDKETGSKVDDP
jgi:hypothetical protein